MENKFLVETSARHIHVTAETLATLFGKDAMQSCIEFLERLQRTY